MNDLASDRATRFLETYRKVFEQLDVEAIGDLFAYPCHITSDAEAIQLTGLADREAWVGQLKHLVSLYRQMVCAPPRSSALRRPSSHIALCKPRCTGPFATIQETTSAASTRSTR